jgi:hypothetical protein
MAGLQKSVLMLKFTCLVFFITCFFGDGYSQENCKPTVSNGVVFIGKKDSVNHYLGEGMQCDKTDFEIIGFTVVFAGLPGDDNVYSFYEAGNRFGSSVIMNIRKAGKNSIIQFECIKAKDKNGNIFFLKPRLITL